jgi:hypothetical protein
MFFFLFDSIYVPLGQYHVTEHPYESECHLLDHFQVMLAHCWAQLTVGSGSIPSVCGKSMDMSTITVVPRSDPP